MTISGVPYLLDSNLMPQYQIRLLQFKLKLLQFQISDFEVLNNINYNDTQSAILKMQQKFGFPATGIIDDITTLRIDQEFEKIPLDIVLNSCLLDAKLYQAEINKLNIDALNFQEQSDRFTVGLKVIQDQATRIGQSNGIFNHSLLRLVQGTLQTTYQRFNELKNTWNNHRPGIPNFAPGTEFPSFSVNLDPATIAAIAATNAAAAEPTPVSTVPDSINDPIPKRTMGAKMMTVNGAIVNAEGIGIPNIKVIAVDKNIGTDSILENGISDAKGLFNITYFYSLNNKSAPDLQIKALNADDTVLALSGIRYNARSSETLNVILPTNKIQEIPEYDQFTNDLKTYFSIDLNDSNGNQKLYTQLSVLQETDIQQDISYLANKTGWDARLIAILILADQFSTKTSVIGLIRPEFYYVLFRSGLPANDATLSQLPPSKVSHLWQTAIDQKIISKDLESLITSSLTVFTSYYKSQVFQAIPEVGVSTMEELLGVAIENIFQDSSIPPSTLAFIHDRMPSIYLEKQDNMDDFWETVRANLGSSGDKIVTALQLNAKLSFLTINNANIIRKLFNTNSGIKTPLDLVKKGLYQKESWIPLLNNIDIPKEIDGDSLDEKKSNYADFMANQIRLSYPTAVIAEMHKANLSTASYKFLSDHQDKFDIKAHPVEYYLKKNTLSLDKEPLAEIKKVQRILHFSPSEELVSKFLEHKLESASAIASYDEKTFVHKYSSEFGGELETRLIHQKAFQKHSFISSAINSYFLAKSSFPIKIGIDDNISNSGFSSTSSNNASSSTNIDLITPTLENLFGEMTYCSCEECRSWFSPAAYLVDILKFLDFEKNGVNPLNALLKRRPDIQYLQLSCKNTNTVLPYIDLVNEILEYYVANNNINSFKSCDIDDNITSDELIANPQPSSKSQSKEAYKKLKNAIFPLTLPFDQPLETTRRYFNFLETPRHTVMEKFITKDNDDQEWINIYIEQLQFSSIEYDKLFAKKTPTEELYGYNDIGKLLTELSNAKLFSSKMNITYNELNRITKTKTLNYDKTEAIVINNSDETSFKDATLTYPNKNPLTEFGFKKLLYFIRLWKKLGWSIEETDNIFMALSSSELSANNVQEWFKLLIPRIAQLKRIFAALALDQHNDLLPVLALWNDIDTFGENSLYNQMFLKPAILKLDPVFKPDDYGKYLKNKKLFNDPAIDPKTDPQKDHRPALLAAFNLTQLEWDWILDKLGFNDSTELSLQNISKIFRFSYLARCLQLSVQEFSAIKDISGIDPFGSWNLKNPPLLSFITLVNNIKSSELDIGQLVYLLKHQDINGVSALTNENTALGKAFDCSTKEMEHFSCGWINTSTITNSSNPNITGQFNHIIELLEYIQIKKEMNIYDDRLIDLLKNPDAKIEGNDLPHIERITYWDHDDLEATKKSLKLNTDDLKVFKNFKLLYEALKTSKKLKVSIPALLPCLASNKTDDIDQDINAVQTFQNALRARYDNKAWLEVIKPINNKLRMSERDALVTYILQVLKPEGADTPDKLFEYFLIDVEMDSCMLTSRIKQAISSAQLFVQRCLLNLESASKSDPIEASVFNSDKINQWKWKKRFRVRQANLEIYSFPENWLEPELRDDKSPFFKDLESELLQGDITEDSAAIAFGHYLGQLDTVAKLEICGMHYEEDKNIIHVIGCTQGVQRKYYYRKWVKTSWRPWEEINVKIQDNPVLPVVWKDRLFVFWLTTAFVPLVTPIQGKNIMDAVNKSASSQQGYISVNLFWSEYYNGKWQSPKSSDLDNPMLLGDYYALDKFKETNLQLASYLQKNESNEELLVIMINDKAKDNNPDNDKYYFYRLYNTHSLPKIELPITFQEGVTTNKLIKKQLEKVTQVFKQNYFKEDLNHKTSLMIKYHQNDKIYAATTENIAANFVTPLQNLNTPYETPFFYQDENYSFFIKPHKSLAFIKNSLRWWPTRKIEIPHLSPLTTLPAVTLRPREWIPDPVNWNALDLSKEKINPAIFKNNIKSVISSPFTVSFGNQKIGAAGSEKILLNKELIE